MRELKNTKLYYRIGFFISAPLCVLFGWLTYICVIQPSMWFWVLAVSSALAAGWLFRSSVWPFLRCEYFIRRVDGSTAYIAGKAGCSTRQGELGSGKSLSSVQEIGVKSELVWAALQRDYRCMKAQAGKWYREGNADKLKLWAETRAAYKFYKNHPDKIPCLFSNIPITDASGRVSHQLTIGHLTQSVRLYRANVFIDEGEFFIDQDLYMEKTERVELLKRFMRFFRHFIGNGCRLIITEQNAESTYKGIRNVMASFDTMTALDVVLKPRLLDWIDERWLGRLMNSRKPGDAGERWARYNKFVVFKKSIGFFVFTYYVESVRGSRFVEPKAVTVCSPLNLSYHYNDRAFMDLYAARDKKARSTKFRSDYVRPDIKVMSYIPKSEREAAEREALQRESFELVRRLLADDEKKDALVKLVKDNDWLHGAVEKLAKRDDLRQQAEHLDSQARKAG